MRVVLKALDGVLTSKVFEVSDTCAAGLYWAFCPRLNMYKYSYNKQFLPELDFPKVLKFETTGRIFRDGKRKPIYEFELTEI